MRRWLVVAAMTAVVGAAAHVPARAEVVILGAEGVRATGEAAVLRVSPDGQLRVDLLVSLADDSPRERDVYVLVPLDRPVTGEVRYDHLPADRFQREHVDPLIALFHQTLMAEKRHEAAALRAAIGGGFLSGPVGALVLLQQGRRGVGRVRGYDRLGAMVPEGVRFRTVQVRTLETLRADELAALPGLHDLTAAERAALGPYEGRPAVLVKARTKRNWRELRGGSALWAEGVWLGFAQEMVTGRDGSPGYTYPLRARTKDETIRSASLQALFVTAPDTAALEVSFPARPPTRDLMDYESLMAYAEESAVWASHGRQVHMARYEGDAPEGEIEIRVRGERDAFAAAAAKAQQRRARAAWILLPLLGALSWTLAFVAIGRRSPSAQELGIGRGLWRSWWVAQVVLLGPVLVFQWTLWSLFQWPIRYVLASAEVRWTHVVYGLTLFLPVVLTVWGLVVIASFRAQGKGRFLLWSMASAVGAGVAYVYAARILMRWLAG